MRARILLRAVAVLASVWLAGCVAGGPLTAHEAVTETRPFDAGGEFILENVNGRVELATWSEPRVRIEADKAAASGELLRRLRVEIDGEGRRVTVRTRTARGWLFGGGGKVDYRITLPADARVRVTTVNGSVQVTGIAGRVRASTTNGSVEVRDVAGEVEASTVNGAIEARYRALDPDGRHRFSTTNGSVTVAVPAGAGGRVEASTVNGRIDNDLPLESTDRSSRRRLEGRLGKGTGSIELSTVNGSVRLRRG